EQGQWKGKIVRAELYELQHADLGRKYAEKDRRSLDPPPVVALRLSEITPMGQWAFQENEILDYSNVEIIGVLCAAELIPVIESRSSGQLLPTSRTSTVHSHSNPYSDGDCRMPTEVRDLSSGGNARIPSSEIARLTANVLVGSKVVQPHLVELDGEKRLVFVFSDLAVKNLGLFRLRYKCFDLVSAVPGTDAKIQAECTGGNFRIFSTKEFPGLQVSTNLTKILSAQGVSLNIRNSERRHKRRKVS
ncbi:velvet factor, partial [Lentinula aciculospora]